MSNNDRLMRAIYAAVDELNGQLPTGIHVEKSLDAPLYGPGGKLESIDLVGFIIEVEEKVKEELGVHLTIADDRAISEQNSPFITLGTLAEYIAGLLKEHEATTD